MEHPSTPPLAPLAALCAVSGAAILGLGVALLPTQSFTLLTGAVLGAMVPLTAMAWAFKTGRWQQSTVASLEQAPVEVEARDPSAPLRVLVVDDVPLNRSIVSRILSSRGLSVLQASSGEAALTMLQDQRIDLVFLDLHMPGLSGIEVAQRLRATGDQVPVVALTADAISGTREACLAAGMDAFINKPAPPRDLFQLVDGLTQGAHRQSAHKAA